MHPVANHLVRKLFPYKEADSLEHFSKYHAFVSQLSQFDQYAWCFLYAYVYASEHLYAMHGEWHQNSLARLEGFECYINRRQSNAPVPGDYYRYVVFQFEFKPMKRGRSVHRVTVVAKDALEADHIAYQAVKRKGLLNHTGEEVESFIRTLRTNNISSAYLTTQTFILTHFMQQPLESGYFPVTKDYRIYTKRMKFTPCNLRQIAIDEILADLD